MGLRQILCKTCNQGFRTRTGEALDEAVVLAFREKHPASAHEVLGVDFATGLHAPLEKPKER